MEHVSLYNWRQAQKIREVRLGSRVGITEVVAVARYGARVAFDENYIKRVERCREAVDHFSGDRKLIYGITTGLGENCNRYISEEERQTIQRNHVLSHSCSVGCALEEECVRAMMFVMLQHFGSGYTGMSMEPLYLLANMLNQRVTPEVPAHGTVGYICQEAHIGAAVIGVGLCRYNGILYNSDEALRLAGLSPVILKSKEGLTFVSGTTSVTAFASLGLYDALNVAMTADISGAISLEVLKGTLQAMDVRVHQVRPHEHQMKTAQNILKLTQDSPILEKYQGQRVQDALSLRSIPQLHGAAKKILFDGLKTVTIELNSSVDNPLIFEEPQGEFEAIMACNADGAYVGISCDCAAIALTNLMKMSERRIDRTINHHVSDLPPFLNASPGINNGLMIPQYTAAGLLGEMKLLSTPATIDNAVTCANQEDYTSMGGNAAMKLYRASRLAQYILAIELLNGCQALDFYYDEGLRPSVASGVVYDLIRQVVPKVEEDCLLHPYIEAIFSLVARGEVLRIVEGVVGLLAG